MFEKELEREEKTLAAERGRSPSVAASVGGPAEPTAQAPAADHLQLVSPAAKADLPSAVRSVSAPPSNSQEAAELADDAFLDEESFAEEPFEEPLRKPRLIAMGKSKGRRLVKPEETPQPSAAHDGG